MSSVAVGTKLFIIYVRKDYKRLKFEGILLVSLVWLILNTFDLYQSLSENGSSSSSWFLTPYIWWSCCDERIPSGAASSNDKVCILPGWPISCLLDSLALLGCLWSKMIPSSIVFCMLGIIDDMTMELISWLSRNILWCCWMAAMPAWAPDGVSRSRLVFRILA